MRELVDSSELSIRRKVSPPRAPRAAAPSPQSSSPEQPRGSSTIALQKESSQPSADTRRPSIVASASMAYDRVSQSSSGNALASLGAMIDRADRGFDDEHID